MEMQVQKMRVSRIYREEYKLTDSLELAQKSLKN